MNILHHKSWHVRNKDNIQRVKRDEAKQAAEEKEKLRRKEIAESETRLNILRSKGSNPSKLVEYDDFLHQKNVNLFEEEELKKNEDDKNEEAELEKKEEKEKFEKKIGLLKYLVDDEMLDLKNQPWYKTIKSRKSDPLTDDAEIDLKRKKRMDPMTTVNDLLKESESSKKQKKEEEKKNHKKKKSQDEKNRSTTQTPTTSKVKTIEQLRTERLKRESEERMRAERLLSGKKDVPVVPKIEVDDRKRRYNNQFNPEISKY